MKIPFDLNGKVEKITVKELAARLWPFGTWMVIYNHVLSGESKSEGNKKKLAVNSYYLFRDITAMRAVAIEKKGGLFHGIRFKPRTRPE